MARVGVLEKDTAMLFTYDTEESCTQYLRCQQSKLAKDLGLTFKSMIEYISKNKPFNGYELWKLTIDNKMVKIN